MDQEQDNQTNIIDTTDCLEAVSVFRSWKNVFFAITFITLLLIQVCFWLVDTGVVTGDQKDKTATQVTLEKTEITSTLSEKADGETSEETKTIKEAATEPNKVIVVESPPKNIPLNIKLTLKHISLVIKCCNFVLILTAVLYCLTILFSLKVSLLGRLGGINHISRAFFLSLIFIVLLMPWQQLTGGLTKGYIFTPQELFADTINAGDRNIILLAIHYLRYAAFWLIEILLLIFAQLRTSRWAKTILRRLEVI